MDFGLFAAAYCLFHATHGIADYWLQTDYQAANKTKKIDALSRHIIVYTLSFIPALLLLGVPFLSLKMLALLLLIGLPHMWMDTRKFLYWFIAKTKNWKENFGDLNSFSNGYAPAVAVRTHVTIEMDQKFHYACLAIAAIVLVLL